MKSIIEELISQNSQFMDNIKYNEEYWQLTKYGNNIYEKLKATLNKKQIELLDKLLDNHADLSAEASECHLLQGFKAGIKLMVECL
ncbi:MAG: hypothetical protein K2N23_02125 [Clostridia bacterium]|nr:hypothetical protein [Clostridia bacterium]